MGESLGEPEGEVEILGTFVGLDDGIVLSVGDVLIVGPLDRVG